MDIDKDGKLNKDDLEQILRLDTVSLKNVNIQEMID